jgi:hypothetical protein
MVIEPPRQFLGSCVFEIDDRILVGIKHLEVKQVTGAVQQSRVADFGFRMDPFFIEASKRRRGGNSVETMAVVKDAKIHF